MSLIYTNPLLIQLNSQIISRLLVFRNETAVSEQPNLFG